MSALIGTITVVVYAIAIGLLWYERSLRYLLMLFAGLLAMLLTPLWQRIYAFSSEVTRPQLLGLFRLPSLAVLLGGGTLLALPPLVFYYGLRHRWWPRHYATIWLGYVAFVIYFLLIERLLDGSGAALFSDALVVGDTAVPAALIQAVLIGGVSLGMLYALVSTRHYALEVAVLPLLLSGIVSAFLFLGIFASPLLVSGYLLDGQRIFVMIAALVSLALVLWGVHLLASGLHAGRRQQLLWR